MLGKKDMNNDERKSDLNTIIGKGSEVQGTINIQHSVRVDGKIKGNITADDTLIVGREGIVEGEIHVKNAVIGGRVEGIITAEGKIVLEANSFFRGEMKSTKLVIDEGAIFEGKSSMANEVQALPAASVRPKGLFIKEKKKEEKIDIQGPQTGNV